MLEKCRLPRVLFSDQFTRNNKKNKLFKVGSKKIFACKIARATPLFFFLGHEDQAEHTRGNNSKNEDEGELKKQRKIARSSSWLCGLLYWIFSPSLCSFFQIFACAAQTLKKNIILYFMLYRNHAKRQKKMRDGIKPEFPIFNGSFSVFSAKRQKDRGMEQQAR